MMLRNRLDALRPKRWDYLFLDPHHRWVFCLWLRS